jgi:acetylornithine deacetylase
MDAATLSAGAAARPDADAAAPGRETLQWIERLLAINTVSRESNLGLIELARDHLARLGADCRLTYDAAGRKANLLATLGDGSARGLVLSAHTDTVPVDDQDWSVEPFAATVRGERVYGRGSCDMKGFIGCLLAAAPRLAQAGARPFHIALSYDEEVGCFGAPQLIADLHDAGHAPAGCIIGEPTNMIPATAHKGVYRYRCCVRGKEAHSSLAPQAVNAIDYAARLITHLQAIAGELARTEHWAGFDVPHTTASVGMIRGGIADNVVPRDCEFRFEFRNLPDRSVRQLLDDVMAHARTLEAEMQRTAREAGFRFETICEVPEFLGRDDDAITRLAQALCGERRTTLVAFGTEAGLFSRAGIPTVVCGPGSIEQAHQPDEYVSFAQLAACERFLQRLADAPAEWLPR